MSGCNTTLKGMERKERGVWCKSEEGVRGVYKVADGRFRVPGAALLARHQPEAKKKQT